MLTRSRYKGKRISFDFSADTYKRCLSPPQLDLMFVGRVFKSPALPAAEFEGIGSYHIWYLRRPHSPILATEPALRRDFAELIQIPHII